MSHIPPSRLAFLMASPDRLEEVAQEELPDLLASLEGFRARVWLRLNAPQKPAQSGKVDEGTDRLLKAEEASMRLGVTKKYLYTNADRLPFTRRIGDRTVRFSEKGIEAYLRERRSR